jgi:hypothetical protein
LAPAAQAQAAGFANSALSLGPCYGPRLDFRCLELTPTTPGPRPALALICYKTPGSTWPDEVLLLTLLFAFSHSFLFLYCCPLGYWS